MDNLIAGFYISIGIMTLTGILAVGSCLLLPKFRRVSLYIAITAFGTVAYQVATINYHTAPTINSAILALCYQMASMYLVLPAFASIAVYFAQPQWEKRALLPLSILSLSGLAFVFLSDFTPRFDTVNGLVPIWPGSSLVRIDGQTGFANFLFHASTSGLILPVYVYGIASHWRSSPRIAKALAFCLLPVLSTAIWGILADKGLVPSIYLAGGSLSLVVLIVCFLLLIEFRLAQEASWRIQEAIKSVAVGVSQSGDNTFFRQMADIAAEITGAKIVFIGLIDNPRFPEKVQTSVVINRGEVADNFSYDLADTPCASAIGQGAYYYPDNVQRYFPKDKMLVDMGIRGYFGFPISDTAGKPFGIFVVLHDDALVIDDEKRQIINLFSARATAEFARITSEKAVRRMAYEDYLTGLPNRQSLFDQVDALVAKPKKPGAALILLNIDHFKLVNDELGPEVGDELLKVSGRRFLEESGASATFKLAGDEFAFLVEDQPLGDVVDKLVSLIRRPYKIGDVIVNLECSIGVSRFGPLIQASDVMRHADIALQTAKQRGRNQAVFFQAQMEADLKERNSIERVIRSALLNEGFELFYQPQVTAAGSVFGVEALIRCNDPEMGWIRPDKLISVAEESGLIHKLGAWVTKEASEALDRLSDVSPTLRMSINVSSWEFARDDYLASVTEILDYDTVKAKRITLELTESGLLGDTEDAVTKMESLRSCGFRVALDDFGTGYSSLSYLHRLPLDELKIDKSFVDPLVNDPNAPMVRSIITIASHLKLEIVAEGVETADQLTMLDQLGCQFIQGYHIAKPMPEGDLRSWLINNNLRKLKQPANII